MLERYVLLEETNRLHTPTTSKNEVATQDFQHTTTREAHRDVCHH